MHLQNRKLWLGLSWFWLLFIIIFSVITLPKTVGVNIPNLDKLEHAFSYLLLMFLFAQCYTHYKTRIVYAIAFTAVGIVLEIIQSFTATRQFEYADMVANTSGVIAGLILADSYLRKIVLFVDKKM